MLTLAALNADASTLGRALSHGDLWIARSIAEQIVQLAATLDNDELFASAKELAARMGSVSEAPSTGVGLALMRFGRAIDDALEASG
ncbi:hypothetical protein [Xanthomonas sp. NCPPB 2632]|uniref:hypothetical protein n=1 Tax=Xanthomonas sp. NCPPB 2632 TaxID=3240912 RepID=UPI003514CE52